MAKAWIKSLMAVVTVVQISQKSHFIATNSQRPGERRKRRLRRGYHNQFFFKVKADSYNNNSRLKGLLGLCHVPVWITYSR